MLIKDNYIFFSILNEKVTQFSKNKPNLLAEELCIIWAAAGHPVFGLFPGLFEQVLKSSLHLCSVHSIIIFQLFEQLVNCWRMQVSFHIRITWLSNHLMRDLMGKKMNWVRLKYKNIHRAGLWISKVEILASSQLQILVPQRDGCTLWSYERGPALLLSFHSGPSGLVCQWRTSFAWP